VGVGVVAGCNAQPSTDSVTRSLPAWTLEVGNHRTSVTLPARLNAYANEGELSSSGVPDREGAFVLTTRVTLSAEERQRPLKLVVQSPEAPMALLVNGRPASTTSTSLVNGYRRNGPHVFALPQEELARAEITLNLAVQHQWTQSAWVTAVPLITDNADSYVNFGSFNNVIVPIGATILCLQIGLICLGVYLMDRRRRSYFYFGCQIIFASVYPFYVSTLLQLPFGRYDVVVMVASLTLAGFVSVKFVHAFFGLAAPSRWWDRAYTVLGLVVPVLIADPFRITRIAGVVNVAAILTALLYVCFVLARVGWRRRTPNASAQVLFVLWSLFILLCAPDFALWIGSPLSWIPGALRTGPIGLTVLALALSIVLTREHQQSMRNTDKLNAELQERIALLEKNQVEIEQLNADLKRQVAVRADQFLAALSGEVASHRPSLEAGTVVSARYAVVQPLGQGGMGSVFEVERLSDRKHFALKVTHSPRGQALARLAREARIVATVTHPNVVSVVDVDIDRTQASGYFLYLVMELVRGPSLAEVIDADRPQSWKLEVLRQVAQGLGALHDASIVHRDVTPANVLLEGNLAEPRVKLTDFGISREDGEREPSKSDPGEQGLPSIAVPDASAGPKKSQFAGVVIEDKCDFDEALGVLGEFDLSDTTMQLAIESGGALPSVPVVRSSGVSVRQLTHGGVLSGTPMFIAPEAVRSVAVTASADMFAFGVLAFRLLEGTAPFDESVAVSLLEKRSAAARKPFSKTPSSWTDFRNLVELCLSFKPEQRPSARVAAEIIAGTIRESISAAT